MEEWVYIKWRDSFGGAESWADRGEKNKPVIVESVGAVLHEEKMFIQIAGTVSDTQCLGSLTIPRAAILVKEELTISKQEVEEPL